MKSRVQSSSQGIWGKTLSIILVLIILSALGMLGYTIASPGTGERFTEFYLLGLNRKAIDYPIRLVLGEGGEAVVGIINREQVKTTYRVEVRIGGVVIGETEPITLEHKEEWKESVSFIPNRIGDKQKVEFLLYKQGQSEVYQRLYLWVDVR